MIPRYSTDLTDAQWVLVEAFFPAVSREDGRNGRIRNYELYLSDDGSNFGVPVVSGAMPNEGTIQTLTLSASRTARFLKLVWKSEYSDHGLGSLTELNIVPAE